MACSFKKSSIYSPESTVSSLLASCSLNGSNSYSNSVIQYKDKTYNSASQALEAYIEDFDQSLLSSNASTGKICLNQSTSKDFKSSCYHCVQKYALEDFNQQVKPDSIASPFLRQTVCDADLISLTTDDLLAFPADGSLPFIHGTPSRSGLQSSKRIRKSLKKSAFYPYQTSFDVEKDFDFQDDDNAVGNQNQYKVTDKEKHNVYKSHNYGSLFSKENSGDCLFQQDSTSISVKNYPRWLTSHKSDINVSGISSVPDFKYPIWLESHNLLSDSANQSFIQPCNMQDGFSSSQTGENPKKNIMDKLECNSFEKNSYLDPVSDCEVTGNCRYNRQTEYFQSGDVLSRQFKQPFREEAHFHQSQQTFDVEQQDLPQDDQIELLILKAKRTLESSAENLSSALKNDGSPCTVDILEAERSWENVPVAFKPPVPVHCEEDNSLQSPKADIVHEFLEDCLNIETQESTFSGGNHHGPVEALKLMLFNLQAVHESFNQNKSAEQNDEFKKLSEEAVSELKLCDNDVIPVTKSLRRALHHLSRLKGLVEDTSGKQDPKDCHQEDWKEKDNLHMKNVFLETEQSL